MIWLVLTIALWGALHSWMASLGFKAALRRIFGDAASRYYRLTYNAASVLSFLPVLVLTSLLPDRRLYTIPPPWLYLMLAGQLASIVCILLALFQVDAASFLGLRQVLQGEQPSVLVTNGFYRWVRHPLYLFGLLIIWLTPFLTLNMLIVYLALTLYIILGATFEERKLQREFGSAYADYKARTPMIIPLPWRRTKASGAASPHVTS